MRSREIDWAAAMRAAMAGDRDAYRQFLVAVTPHVRTIARARCRSLGAPEAEAEDVVQEVLLAIHLKRGTWDQARPIGPWVSAIVRHKVVDALRRRSRHVSVPIDDVIDILPAEDRAPSLTHHDIDHLLGQLKPQPKEIVQSVSLNGESIGETARRLRMTEGAVRVALHRALKALGVIHRSSAHED
jgi:RNA polymerase sigma factor (sigma-70 family)